MRGRLLSALVVAVAFPAAPTAGASPRRPEEPGLRVRESLAQTLSFARRGPEPGLALRETRRLRAEATLPLEGAPALDADSLLGIRIGEWIAEGRLEDDPRWRPGRARARLRLRTEGPEGVEVVTLTARWKDGALALRASGRGAAPLAATRREDPAGTVDAPVDAAVRLGDLGWRLGGSAAGILARTGTQVLGAPVSLARIALEGSISVLAETEDADLPSVAIAAPAEDALLPIGTLSVTGTLGDHRTLASVTWSLNGGPPTEVPFAVDPETGFLTDIAATFDFPVAPVPGRNTLVVTARDAAGNEGASSVEFAVVVPREVPLAAAGFFGMATDATGGVRTWGYAYHMGIPNQASPTPLPGLEGAVAMAGGTAHGLALLPDGTVRSWGSNASGQLGYSTGFPPASVTVPAEVPGLEGIVAIAARDYNSMALRADGAVFAWGNNSIGQAGDGTQGGYLASPVLVPALPPCRAIGLCSGIRAEWPTLFAVAEDGGVWAWGDDSFGQLARGNVTPRHSLVPVPLAGLSGILSVSGGFGFAVAVREDGKVVGWGRDNKGQIPGAYRVGSHAAPFVIAGAEGIVQAACGFEFTLLLRDDGVVLACGGNQYGQLGNGTTFEPDATVPEPLPAPVPGLAGVTRIASTLYTGYAVREDGSLWCWGRNTSGEVGDGTMVDRPSPVLVLLDP